MGYLWGRKGFCVTRMSNRCAAILWIDLIVREAVFCQGHVKLDWALNCVLSYHIATKACMCCVKGFWVMDVSDVIFHV